VNVVEDHSMVDTNPKEPRDPEFQQLHPNVRGVGSNMSCRLLDTCMQEENDKLDDHHLVSSRLVSSEINKNCSITVDYNDHVRSFHYLCYFNFSVNACSTSA